MRIRDAIGCLVRGHDWRLYGDDWATRWIVRKRCGRCGGDMTEHIEHKPSAEV